MKIADTDIDRFIVAQDNAYSGYAQALSEIRKGKKTSHWIWYIFPQFREFGHSSTALYYGIADREEAYRYLTNPMLRERLYEITNALLEHKGKDIVSIFGELDAKKVRSCMTMFDCLSPNDVFGEVLDCFYNGVRGGRTLKVMGFEAKAPLAIKYTPEKITSLKPDEVYVFGTNPKGKHTSKAAILAVNSFGAVVDQGEGLFGQSYAIPVHKHRTWEMVMAVNRFIKFAKENPDKKFYVIAIGCGSAGMDPAFVALMFRNAMDMDNVYLPKIFIEELSHYYDIGVEISDDCREIIRFPMHFHDKYVVPYGIEVLGTESFMGCSCQLELPDSIKRIEKYAFSDMGPLDYYLKIPASVSYIDDTAFDGEWISPGMLVNYKSYAYEFAKAHKIRYRCVDFDEEKYLKRQREIINQHNRSIHGIREYTNKQLLPPHGEAVSKGQIAIARNFGIVLNDDGHLTLVGCNENFRQLVSSEVIIKVTASFDGYLGLLENGRLITSGNDGHKRYFEREIESLSNVKDVVASEGHTIVLFKDGSVKCIDGPSGWEGIPEHSKIVKSWNNIKQVAVGYANVMGLTDEGRVLYHSEDGYTDSHYYDNYSDIIQIDCYSHYYGTDSSAVLHKNGTVSSDTFKGVETWKDIIQISVGADIVVGLKKDGTIEMIDDRSTRYAAKEWTNLACIECKFFGIVGITKDGQVLSYFY